MTAADPQAWAFAGAVSAMHEAPMQTQSAPARVAVLSRSFSRHPVLRSELLARYPGAQFNETGRTLAGSEIVSFLQGADKIIVALEKVDAALLEQLPDLRVLSKFGVGLDNVDLHAAARRGLRVGWTGGVNARSVAELAVCLMVACLRGVVASNLEVRGGTWRQSGGGILHGRTVGLLGCGHVGHAEAPLLAPYG
jgi:phosphoglycerate dehydrogenase-like enzyme